MEMIPSETRLMLLSKALSIAEGIEDQSHHEVQRAEDNRGENSSNLNMSNFARANKILVELNLKEENLTPVEERRALIFLLGWPESDRESVLKAARDRSFVIGALPKEVLKAAREDTIGLLPPPPPPVPFFDPAVAFGTPVLPLPGLNGGFRPPQRAIRKRSPQTCKKCLQPRRGHICSAIIAGGPDPSRHPMQTASSYALAHLGTSLPTPASSHPGLYASSTIPASLPHATSSQLMSSLQSHPHHTTSSSTHRHLHDDGDDDEDDDESDEQTARVVQNLSEMRSMDRSHSKEHSSSYDDKSKRLRTD